MPQYTPPLRDMKFVLHELLGAVDELKMMPRHADVDADTLNAVLEEGGRFAAEITAPINSSGDAEGCTLDRTTHAVTTPKGFKEAYAKYVEGGWPALSCDPAYGGQGLPLVVNQCLYEMLNSANQAWTMYPGLSHGAHACLHEHGTPEQKATFLPKLTSGEWTGTMCLTESHCGTDLGMLRSKALTRRRTARWSHHRFRRSSSRAGEHDMSRKHHPPGAGPRCRTHRKARKGISLFLVPKFLAKRRRLASASAMASLAARIEAKNGHPR